MRLGYAFLDESEGGDFLVVTILVTSRPRPIELHVKRTLKKWGTRLSSGELKAAFAPSHVIRRLLSAIAEEDVEILGLVLDKRVMVHPFDDHEASYRATVAEAARCCVERWPRLELHLDKRYTNEKQRRELERAIREAIAEIPDQMVVIYQERSLDRKELQAADFVAWAFYRKYQHGDSSFYELIREKVVAEIVLEAGKWQKIKSGPPWGPMTTALWVSPGGSL